MLFKLGSSISNLFKGKSNVDENTGQDLLESLLLSDISYEVAEALVEDLKKKYKGNTTDDHSIKEFLYDRLKNELNGIEREINLTGNPLTFVVCGVNGSGKTTAIGKLSKYYHDKGRQVMVAACDTFRAAANSQLAKWAERSGAEFYFKEEAKDPASVAYDAYREAKDKNFDVLFVDTAGRLHSNKGLMDQLSKIERVIGNVKSDDDAVLNVLVLDATTGQNMLEQIEHFGKAVKLDGIIVNKLDSASKGGAVISAFKKYKLPIFFAGVGEKIGDIRSFDKGWFLKQLLDIK
jgi:fused signal recognition particle receptor